MRKICDQPGNKNLKIKFFFKKTDIFLLWSTCLTNGRHPCCPKDTAGGLHPCHYSCTVKRPLCTTWLAICRSKGRFAKAARRRVCKCSWWWSYYANCTPTRDTTHWYNYFFGFSIQILLVDYHLLSLLFLEIFLFHLIIWPCPSKT